MKGILYLVPTPIGNLKEVSPRFLEVINSVDFIASEDTRNTTRLLSMLGVSKKVVVSCHEHNERSESEKIVNKILEGKNVAYMSDAGYPCISDPGSLLVEEAIRNGITITPISGPNAFLNGLVASGIDSSHFLFYGFLDAKETKRIKELESLKPLPYTLIFYEAPHRINDTLLSMKNVFGNRKITIARELTKIHEEFIRTDLDTITSSDKEFIGEMVLVVSKNDDTKNSDGIETFLEKVKLLVNNGFSLKDSVLAVSLLFDVNKNQLYKSAINLK